MLERLTGSPDVSLERDWFSPVTAVSARRAKHREFRSSCAIADDVILCCCVHHAEDSNCPMNATPAPVLTGPMMRHVIRVGHIDLSFHDASALEVEMVLKKHGHVVERSAAPHEAMFKKLEHGEVDIVVSAWLPSSHGAYLAPVQADILKVSILYRPYCIWGVPDYVPESQLASVEDLLRAPVLGRMEKLIQGINPGAGISRFSKAIVEQYRLDEAGYHFETGTEAQCFNRFEEAVAGRRWVVIPLWHPQFLHHRYRIRGLSEPKGLLGGVDEATLIVRRDAESRIGGGAMTELSALRLGNARVSELDDRLRIERQLQERKIQ